MSKSDYEVLVDFWNQGFSISEEEAKELAKEVDEKNYESLAPSNKQLEVLKQMKNKESILDYGCGSGWASIILAKLGAKRISACDVSANSIKALKLYAKAYGVSDSINAFEIDKDWIKYEDSNKYDAFFSSNVIDVIPIDMAKDIIKEASRVTKNDGIVVFSLNYYIDPLVMKEKGYNVNGPYVYIDGVLRLTSLSDDEWISIFKDYFEVVGFSYFSWPGEQRETRRLFILRPLN